MGTMRTAMRNRVVMIVAGLLCCHSSEVEAAPLAECDDNANPSAVHCVCKDGFLCSGSKCSHGRASHQEGVAVKSGYVRACQDCKCLTGVAVTVPPATVAEGAGAGDTVGDSNSDSVETAPVAAPGQGLNAFFGIKTGADKKYAARREAWRKSGCAEKYAAAGIRWKFFVGVPMEARHVLTNHDQGSKDTAGERENAKFLNEEYNKYKDLQVVNYRDQYMDLTNKLLGIFRYGYDHTNADFIGEHDDEYCVNPEVMQKLIEEHKQNHAGKELYGGNYQWKGDEYKAMIGVNGMISTYMSGWCSFLSRKLIGYIVTEDWTHSVLAGQYGTQADDANTGKWVDFAMEQHGFETHYASNRAIITEAGKLKPA